LHAAGVVHSIVVPRLSLLLAIAAACGGSNSAGDDAGIHDAPAPVADAATALPNTFRFAVVGDTRPANEDDVTGYPTGVITGIWAKVEALSPHPDFAISTGDYMFASPSKMPPTVDNQLDLYLHARGQFTNAVFAAMGNHECTGATASNCGPQSASGITINYAEFLKRMLNPLGITQPYYAYMFHATDNSWTAKVVFIAANAWNATQSAWLDTTLAMPTTYTFVVRHESSQTTDTPGVTPSEAIIAKYPFTFRIVGHTHTYSKSVPSKEMIVGNGGAPPSSGMNYGYVIVERLASGDIQISEYDYSTNAMRDQFRIHADGSSAP
jgi:hypothetical protein